jgi:hypothetical protein
VEITLQKRREEEREREEERRAEEYRKKAEETHIRIKEVTD